MPGHALPHPESRWFETADAALHVREVGSGPPLLLVHGFPLHQETWRHVVPTLARTHRCMLVDLPGLGLSRWNDSTDLTFHGHARRLRHLMAEVAPDGYSVMAHDTGATVVRVLAADDGDRVRRGVYLNTEMPGHRPPWIPTLQRLSRLPAAGASFQVLLRSRAFCRSPMAYAGLYADPALLDDDFRARYVDPLVHDPVRIDGAMRYLRGVRWQTVDDLDRLHAAAPTRTLLVWGEDCRTFPIGTARAMEARMPRSDGLVAVPRAALLPHEEQPQAVLDAVVPFLAG